MLRLPSFTYLQPRTLHEALAMKTDAGPAGMYVAGGTDLYPNMKRRHQEPTTVVSLDKVRGLSVIAGPAQNGTTARRHNGMVLGPCVTLTELSQHPKVRKQYS